MRRIFNSVHDRDVLALCQTVTCRLVETVHGNSATRQPDPATIRLLPTYSPCQTDVSVNRFSPCMILWVNVSFQTLIDRFADVQSWISAEPVLTLVKCDFTERQLFRRIRELNENNTKKFIDERKRQALTQSRQMDQLRKLHQEQFDKLRHEMKSVSMCYVALRTACAAWRHWTGSRLE